MTAVYPADDPRSQLAPAGARRAVGAEVLPMQTFEFADLEPDEITEAGSRSWIVRAQNIVLVLTDLVADDERARDDVDETMLLVLDTTGPLTVTAGDESADVDASSIVVLPPGRTRVVAGAPARIIRLFATTASDLVARARNRNLYDPSPASIGVHAPWPEPAGGSRLRVYRDLDAIPSSAERMGRIFRNRHAMVNVLYPRVGPRDPRTLSPHDHDDFEQLSFVVTGDYVHHIRAHWGRDRLQWREDEHLIAGAPSLAIIPPPLVHTSEAVGEGLNRMIDIFAGPRSDFSARPGWVLNEADYPMPQEAGR